MADPGTTAPLQTYPTITPAPRSSGPDPAPDTRKGAAPDQSYPKITPAPKVVETFCSLCGKPH